MNDGYILQCSAVVLLAELALEAVNAKRVYIQLAWQPLKAEGSHLARDTRTGRKYQVSPT